MAIVMGIDIGQRREPSAICVVETQARNVDGRSEVHHMVRHLERLPTSTSFPEIARRAGQISTDIEARTSGAPRLYVDATGLGQPVIDLIDEAVLNVRAVTPVFFTHGDRRIEIGNSWRLEVQLGKAHLVCRLQTLLQTARLHLPRTPEAQTLARELRKYEIQVSSDANERYGAFSVGTQDELVTALGLAVQKGPPGPGIY